MRFYKVPVFVVDKVRYLVTSNKLFGCPEMTMYDTMYSY